MSMKRTTGSLVLLLFYLWRNVRAVERPALCLLSSPCVLPCPFDPGPEVVIHWLKLPDEKSSVHSYYHDSDQLGRQHPSFRGRTSLFKEHIAEGNASLRLTGITLSDRGKYKCYSSTTIGNSEDYVIVHVHAPVLDVWMEQEEQLVRCRSENIFPRPVVTWNISSPDDTTVSESNTGLFSVSSSMPLTHNHPVVYSCNISTEHSWRSATYRRTDGVTWSRDETVLPCAEAETSIKSLVWTFNRTHIILNQTGPDLHLDQDWEHRVGRGSGSELVLKDLSPEQQGLFSCELTTDRTSYLTVTEVTVNQAATGAVQTSVIVAVSVTLSLLLVVVLGIIAIYKIRQKKKSYHKTNQNSNKEPKSHQLTELEHLQNTEGT